MNERLQQWTDTIDGLAIRERVLILVGALAILFLLIDALFYQPATEQQRKLKESIENLQLQFTVLQHEAGALREDGDSNPVTSRGQQIAALEAEEQQLNSAIKEQLGLVMDPDEAHKILKDIVRRDKDVQLLSLVTKVMDLADDMASDDDEEAALLPGINRYQMTLRLKGDYLAMLRFLEKLEALPWALLWEALDLKVVAHPDTEVTLVLYTLGGYGGAS